MSVSSLGQNYGSNFSDALWTSASGLKDASLRMDTVANNVANVNTSGFEPDQIVSGASPSGGVETSVAPKEYAQALALTGRDSIFSGTDLPTELSNMIQAKQAYQANARVIRANDETWDKVFKSA